MQLIHFEHMLPALAELGLEHLVPLFLAGDKIATLDGDTIKKILDSFTHASKTRAIRRLVMVSRATAEDLLEQEVSTAKEQEALKAAALCSPQEAKEAVLSFFSQLGLSLDLSPGSSEEETPQTDAEKTQDAALSAAS